MTCKDKIYTDGEYTLCGTCKKTPICEAAQKCFSCGRTSGVFFDKASDLFCCGKCFHEVLSCEKAK